MTTRAIALLSAGVLASGLGLAAPVHANADDQALAFIAGAAVGYLVADRDSEVRHVHYRGHHPDHYYGPPKYHGKHCKKYHKKHHRKHEKYWRKHGYKHSPYYRDYPYHRSYHDDGYHRRGYHHDRRYERRYDRRDGYHERRRWHS